jgi:hypothetical protein
MPKTFRKIFWCELNRTVGPTLSSTYNPRTNLNREKIVGRILAKTVLVCLAITSPAVSQTNATVSGTVTDTMGALIPGVTVSSTTQTGVVTK